MTTIKSPRVPRQATLEQKAAHALRVIERQIIFRLLNELLEGGYELAIFDGESYLTSRTRNLRTLQAALFTTHKEVIIVYRPTDKTSYGWVELVYGSKGHDVIFDQATCLEDHITEALELATKLKEANDGA